MVPSVLHCREFLQKVRSESGARDAISRRGAREERGDENLRRREEVRRAASLQAPSSMQRIVDCRVSHH